MYVLFRKPVLLLSGFPLKGEETHPSQLNSIWAFQLWLSPNSSSQALSYTHTPLGSWAKLDIEQPLGICGAHLWDLSED